MRRSVPTTGSAVISILRRRSCSIPFHPSFQVLRRSFGKHADELKMATTAQIAEMLGHAAGSKVTRLHCIVKKVGSKVREMQRRINEGLLRMDEKASGTVQ